ncbi:DUF2357 domain-containing protein [Marinomonas pollencensis]|uniref:DUF2357 domain-containing protein n=1 Tax=Marinomonas pollencensis TaxID=491954 RepID=A0A3E0DIV7_9GAMM|nr:DUF2357 domain-containing protein [Marinomonas pollencensis]REG82607.1 hypothetical protein DFP81_10841 [Marinomonas pollencensis]
MKLQLEILNGHRRGTVQFLPDTSENLLHELPVVLENEMIQFELIVPDMYQSASLELYQHSISVSEVTYPSEHPGMIKLTWIPTTGSYSTNSKLFWNYFGVAELSVILMNDAGEIIELVSFQPLQVAASKSQAEKVEQMFEYLAKVSPETLHSTFSATRHSVGFEEGLISPNHTFERIEHALAAFKELIQGILQKPLTRLVPKHRLKPVNGQEDLDDSSVGWLLENLSVLEPTDCPDEAHITFDGDYYKANVLMLPELDETSDIYENWVIHGFVEQLIHTAKNLGSRMESEMGRYTSAASIPSGYVSFFEKLTRFKSLLIGTQISKIEEAIKVLKQFKLLLEQQLPVNRSIHSRPIITPKTINRPAYQNLFLEIIKWHEKGKVDWTAFQNLFAIESIPMLFEAYTYFRVLDHVNRFFARQTIEHPSSEHLIFKNTFIDQFNNEIKIEREPNYWTIGHTRQHPEAIVNSEAYTVRDSSIRRRGQGVNSRRAPDVVIQIKRPNGNIKLIVMDAKYSSPDRSFRDYLPALTMKYLHGIHRLGQREPLIDSLIILHPDDSGKYRSFHQGDFEIFGSTPATPSLLCCGIILGENRQSDILKELVEKTLELVGVKPIKLSNIPSKESA